MIFLIRWLAPSPKAAIDSCGAKGYAVSAVVVDRAGEVIVAMRSDGSSPHTTENARRKAYAALSFRVATSGLRKALRRQQSGCPPTGDIAKYYRDSWRLTGEAGAGGDRRSWSVRLTQCR